MKSIWWVRRDLRLGDNLTLQSAVQAEEVLPVFILDPRLLGTGADRRQGFLFNGLRALDGDLRRRGAYLVVRRGDPGEVLREVMAESGAQVVYAEEDFTPYARQRDAGVAAVLPLKLIQGQLVHHPLAVHKADGDPYTVYTPFSKTWKRLLTGQLESLPAPERIPTPPGIDSLPIPSAPGEAHFPAGEDEAQRRLVSFLFGEMGIFAYGENRDRMDLAGTSTLSPYIHLGMLGLRTAVREARKAIASPIGQGGTNSAEIWLNELIWREFYIHILYHYPHVQHGSFRPVYDRIRWANDLRDFTAWKEGRTGYPVVDAAMRQMLATGWMHNRARMITASFLVKDLLVDWRWGEKWFMQNLLDGDLAANNGGWQWTAGTGTDAAPYFRIFNPVSQSVKFDPEGEYIRRWVPELAHLDAPAIHAPWEKKLTVPGYPHPIIDHKIARQRTLAAYKAVRE